MKSNYGKGVLFALLAAFTLILAGCSEDPPAETPQLVSIEVSRMPTKTVYVIGETLDLTGLEITGTYSGGFTKTETYAAANVSGYDSSSAGAKTLTVTINGKTTTFTVTVTSTALQSIAVSSPPTKTVYAIGETLDLTGLVVTGTYSDGSTQAQTVDISNISGYDSSSAGAKMLTVTISGKTTTFTITVVASLPENPISSISDIALYLLSVSGGSEANTPVELELSVNLAGSGWTNVLSAISNTGKYVTLDLSGSTMSGTEFYPGTGAGADKVVSLALPAGAQSIQNGTYSAPPSKLLPILKR